MIMETDPNIKFPKNIDTIESGEYIKSIPGSSTYEVHTNDGGTRIIRINDATGEVDDNCITLTATFKKGGADSISYDTFKCKVPDGGNSCKIYLPGIYKGDGNAYGWSTNENSPKTATNLMPIGETVEIKSNTTFYAITD